MLENRLVDFDERQKIILNSLLTGAAIIDLKINLKGGPVEAPKRLLNNSL